MTQPAATAQNDAVLGTQPVVQLQDRFGNIVKQPGVSITAAVASGGGTLGGTITVSTNADGEATFSDLVITGTVGDYTLSFSSAGLTSVTSNSISLTAGVAAQLAISTQPSSTAVNGSVITTQPVVQLQDGSGNTVAQSGVEVTVAITLGGGTLSGTLTANTDASGQAAFTDLMISGTIGDRVLGFSSAGLAGATSSTITLIAGNATQLTLSMQPSSTVQSGIAFPVQPVLQLRDANGNAVAQSGVNVTAAVASGGGTLDGTTMVSTNAEGRAVFAGFTLSGAVGERTLAFSSAGLTEATSDSISLTAGTATQLTLTTQPSSTAQSGIAFPTQPVLQLRDAHGNAVGQNGVGVTATIASGGGTLGGIVTVSTDASGQASFTDLSISGTVGDRTLSFSATGLSAAGSNTIVLIAGTASRLVLTGSSTQTAGAAQTLTTTAFDAYGNTATGYMGSKNLTFSGAMGAPAGNQPVANGTNFGSVTSLNFNNGVATASLTLYKAESATISATDGTVGSTGADRLSVTVSPAGAHAVQTTATVPNGMAGSTTSISIQAKDTYGNDLTIGGAAVAVSITGANSATPVVTDNGDGTYTASYTPISTGTDQVAITVGGTPITGSPFNSTVSPGVAMRLRLTGMGTQTAGGSQTVTLAAYDTHGNVAAGYTGSKDITFTGATTAPSGNQPSASGATFGSATALTFSSGVAMASVTLYKAENATLLVTDGTINSTGADRLSVTVSPGASANITSSTGDGQSATVGTAVATAPQVTLTDQYGNPVPGVNVTFAASGNGSVTGSPATTNTSGVATLESWTLATTAGSNTLTATAGSLSTSFMATGLPGAANSLAKAAGDNQSATVNTAVAITPQVRVTDPHGNGVEGIIVTFSTTTGSVTGASQTTDVTGYASAGSWTLSTTAGNNTLTASVTGLADVSFSATGTPGEAHSLTIDPATASVAMGGTKEFTATVRDQHNNILPSPTVSWTSSDTNTVTVSPPSGTSTTATATNTITNDTDVTITATSGTASNTATLTVLSVAPPVAVADSYTTNLGTTLNVSASGVMTNDDLGVPTATLTSFGGGSLSGDAGTNAAGNSVALAGSTLTVNANGSLSLVNPTEGGVFTFQYRLTNAAKSDDAIVTITVNAPPAAVSDGPSATSAPGDAFHTAFNTQLITATAPNAATVSLLANDSLGFPAATVTHFGGGTLGGMVTDTAAGNTKTTDGHSLTVNADGTISYTPRTDFTGLFTFQYRITNDGGHSNATVIIAVGQRPVATTDTYPHMLVGNISIDTSTGTAYSVLSNDTGNGITIAVSGSPSNGSVTLNADGTFTFNPAAGFRNGSASFQYTVSNGFGTSAAATVTIPVGTQVIWFINNGAANCTALANGCGRLSTPFSTLAAFHSINNGSGNNPADNHHIFVYESAAPYVGPLTLRAGQRLFGQDATTGLATLAGVTLPPHSPALPAMNSGNATRSLITSSNFGVIVTLNNTIRGLTLGDAATVALASDTDGFGTLTVSDLAIANGSNAPDSNAIGLHGGPSGSTLDGSFLQVSGRRVSLQQINTAGTSVLGTATDSLETAGEAMRIDGGTGSFTYPGLIQSSGNVAVTVQNKTGGAVTLSGNLNPSTSGGGILIQNNTGGTVTFSGAVKRINTGINTAVNLVNNNGAAINFIGGGLAITTTSGNGFNATSNSGAGTISVQGTGNTINSGTGTALNVSSTTIGSSGLTFQSISANGGANGIVLNNTGSSAGLTVTGMGTAGSGGTIQNTTGADGTTNGIGIYLSSTRDINLAWMQLNDHAGWAIKGVTVTNFTMNETRITGSNGTDAGTDEGGVHFTGLSGSASITNSRIEGGLEDNLTVVHSAGTLNRLTLDSVTIGLNSTTLGEDGVSLEATAGTMNVTVQNSTFTGARARGFNMVVQGTAVGDLVFSGNTISNNHSNPVSAGGAMDVAVGGAGRLTYSITNNTMRDSKGTALYLGKQFGGSPGDGSMSGTVSGNRIGVSGVANSGSLEGSAIEVMVLGRGSHTALVSNNQLRGYNNNGLLVTAGGASETSTGLTHNAVMSITVTGNTIAEPGNNPAISSARNGLHLNSGTNSGDDYQICLNLSNNTVSGSGADPSGFGTGQDYRFRQRQNTTVRMPNYTGAATDASGTLTSDVTNHLTPRTNGTFTLNVTAASNGFVNTSGGAACLTP